MARKLTVLLLLIFTFALRFWNVWSVPAGLYYDEIDAGYQARSLLQTGKSYRGDFSPFYLNSFLDPRPPIPVYLTVLSTAIFQTPELQVRMGQVILGTINVGLVFWLVFKWSKNYWLGIIGLLVSATNPWWIQFSRYNHEAHTSVFFPLIGLIVFIYGLERKKFHYLLISTVLIALSIYTYRTMSLLTPIIFISIGISYFHQLKKLLTLKKIFLILGVFLLITLFLLAFQASTKRALKSFGGSVKTKVIYISTITRVSIVRVVSSTTLIMSLTIISVKIIRLALSC
jgi:4-amino-4-deoxy-L-arabinose transferase-like glycosyltransferase